MALAEFFSGWFAGAAGVIVSHPLDTLRVRLQAAHSSTLRTEFTLLVKEGCWTMWRGLGSPMLFVGFWKAIMFSTSSWTQLMLSRSGDEPRSSGTTPLWHVFACGYMAGAAGLVVQMPMDRIKCVQQASPHFAAPAVEGFAGALRAEAAIATQIWRAEGFAGLYRGTAINFTLCPPAIAVWFGTNEWMLRRADELAASGQLAAGRSSVLVQLACGGIGGTLAWAINYPSDRAKACVQIASVQRPGASSLELLSPYLRNEGPRFFVRGMPATLLRAVPQCAVTICVQARASEMLM